MEDPYFRRKDRQRAKRQTPPPPVGAPAPHQTPPVEGRLPGPLSHMQALDHSALDAAIRDYPRCSIRVLPDASGTVWYKFQIRTPLHPRHYLIVSLSDAEPIARGLAELATKVEAWRAGWLKPSPD